MQSLILLFLGFVAGIKHSLDVDHLTAVSSLVTRHKKLSSAIWAGGWWGIGHTVTLIIVGFIILLFGLNIPSSIESVMESIVGIMLILLGLINIKAGFLDKVHLHKHRHDNHEHFHLHGHEEGERSHDHKHSHSNNIKALIVGFIHGMAGSAALMLLVVTTIKSIPLGLIYILFFGVGSMVGMTIFGLVIGLPVNIAGNRLSSFDKFINIGIGVFSVVIGLSLLIHIFEI